MPFARRAFDGISIWIGANFAAAMAMMRCRWALALVLALALSRQGREV